VISRIAILIAALAVAAAGPALPSEQTAGATISGVVVSTEAPPQPLRRAIVMLTGGAIPTNLSTVADEQGRFRFVDLAPGRYTVSVSKAAYLSTAYGASRPGRQGTAIALAAAGQKVDIRVVLAKGAVVTGTVRDQFGQPAGGIQVTVSPAASIGSIAGVARLDALETDDRGVYRAYGLMPGEYIVSAVPDLTGSGEIFRMSQADFDARVRALEQRHGAANPAAPAAVAPTVSSEAGARTSGAAPPLGFAATYYPGTTIAASAERIRLAAGEERAGVDIPLIPVRAARVSGVVQSDDIEPQRLRPSLSIIGPSQPGFAGPSLIGPMADGSFTFTNVTPGRYNLMVRSGPGAMMMNPDGRGGGSTNAGVPSRFATIDLSVDGSDIGGLVLALRPALTISGRVAFDGSALKPPGNLATISVGLTATGPNVPATSAVSLALGTTRPPTGRAGADGTFTLTGIVPGSYGFSASFAGVGATGWWLRSAVVDGRDLMDLPLEVDGSSSDLAGLVVTFSDRHSGVEGTLTTASGQPASEFVVIAYPVDRSYWRPGARRVVATRPSSDGAFTLMDLPAGEYFLAALTDVDPDDWQQSSFLEQLVSASVKVAIGEGQRVRQDLRIAK
jgi:uncharacterized protein (DUF2141 family)